MEIIGVHHRDEYLDQIDSYISQEYPEGPESLMLELPENFPDIISKYPIGFFDTFLARYAQKGTRIIYGDRGREVSTSGWSGIVDIIRTFNKKITIDKRNEEMADVIRDERPEVVLVGKGHADYLKGEFSDAYYTAFEPESLYRPMDITEWINSKIQPKLYSMIVVKPNKPDRLVLLKEDRIPKYRKAVRNVLFGLGFWLIGSGFDFGTVDDIMRVGSRILAIWNLPRSINYIAYHFMKNRYDDIPELPE